MEDKDVSDRDTLLCLYRKNAKFVVFQVDFLQLVTTQFLDGFS